MSNGIAKIRLGGKDYSLRAELGIAPKIEAATGKGLFAVARDLARMEAPTSMMVAVIQVAMATAGHDMEADDIYKALEAEGLMSGYASANIILTELLRPPAKKPKNAQAAIGPN